MTVREQNGQEVRSTRVGADALTCARSAGGAWKPRLSGHL